MNCRESRFQLALFVGGDLDESSGVGLQRHLATCPECRDHHERLDSVMQQVERSESEAPALVHRKSVWPQLAAVIKVREQDRTRRFNGWVAGFAVAAMALAAVTISQNLPSSQPDLQFSEFGPVDDFGVQASFPMNGGRPMQDRFDHVLPPNQDQRLRQLQQSRPQNDPRFPNFAIPPAPIQ